MYSPVSPAAVSSLLCTLSIAPLALAWRQAYALAEMGQFGTPFFNNIEVCQMLLEKSNLLCIVCELKRVLPKLILSVIKIIVNFITRNIFLMQFRE